MDSIIYVDSIRREETHIWHEAIDVKKNSIYDDEARVLIPRHVSNSEDYWESTLDDGVPELDLMGYEASVSAKVFAQQKCIMFQHFDLSITLSHIIIDVNVEMVNILDAFDVGNLDYAMSIVLMYLGGMIGIGLMYGQLVCVKLVCWVV